MNKNILLVEDEFIIAIGKQQELENYGYVVQYVNTGEKAVSIVNENTDIGLILMDIDLGKGIDGTEAAALILKEHNIPIVFMSSHTESEIIEKTEKITSYGYVVKNSSITVLDASIKMALKLYNSYEKINKSENKLRQIIDLVPHFIFVKDETGKFEIVNKATAKAFGTTVEDLTGRRDSEFVATEEEKERFRADDLEVINSGKTKVISEELMTDSNNNTIYLQTTKVPFKFSSSGSPSVLGVAVDVTEQKVKENTIKTYQQRLALHINQTPLAVIDWDLDFNVIFWNKSAEKIFGFTSEETLGKHATDLIVPENVRDEVDEVWASLIGKTGGARSTNENITKDGKIIQCEWYNTAIINEAGIVIGVSSLVMDITNQKHAQLSLTKNKNFIDSILKSIHDLIFVIDIDKKFTAYHNSSDYKLYTSPENFIGKSIFDVLPEDIAKDTNNAIDEILKTGKLQKFNYSLHVDDDDLRYYESNISPMFDSDKNIISFVSINRNITERKLSEKKIEKQLLEKEIIIKEIHHRIKNNLASIESFISLQIAKSTDSKVISALHGIAGRVNSMTILYEKLLLTNDCSKIPAKQYLTSLIDESISLFINKNIKIESNIDDFKLDCKKLVPIGIITNELCMNAIKYAFIDKDSGHINIILKKENQNITLTITDDGIGIPKNFDMNNQSGFGLILIDLYSQQLDGEFEIKRDNGTKCIFKFNIN